MTMSSYYCYICESTIKGNMFKAYDKNLCSYSCRECLIKKFNFNCNYELEEKPIKKSISCRKIIENRHSEPEYIAFTNDEGEPPCINLSQLFNISPIDSKDSKDEVNEEESYEKYQKRSCINMYIISYSDLTLISMLNKVVEKAKNFSIY